MKVRCVSCLHENNNICSLKKIGVKVNKPRICNEYVLVKEKQKSRAVLPSTKFGYAEQQEAKRQRREANRVPLYREVPEFHGTTANPITGDLSRFITTAGE